MPIVITGTRGAGKSALFNALVGRVNTKTAMDDDAAKHRIHLKHDAFGSACATVVILPGQDPNQSESAPLDLVYGPPRREQSLVYPSGVIHVVNGGFDEPWTATQRRQQIGFVESHIKRLTAELDHLERQIAILGDYRRDVADWDSGVRDAAGEREVELGHVTADEMETIDESSELMDASILATRREAEAVHQDDDRQSFFARAKAFLRRVAKRLRIIDTRISQLQRKADLKRAEIADRMGRLLEAQQVGEYQIFDRTCTRLETAWKRSHGGDRKHVWLIIAVTRHDTYRADHGHDRIGRIKDYYLPGDESSESDSRFVQRLRRLVDAVGGVRDISVAIMPFVGGNLPFSYDSTIPLIESAADQERDNEIRNYFCERLGEFCVGRK